MTGGRDDGFEVKTHIRLLHFGLEVSIAEAGKPTDLAKQQYLTVIDDATAVETGLNTSAFYGWKFKRSSGTFCPRQAPV